MSTTTHTPHESAVMGLIRHLANNDEAKVQQLLAWMAVPVQKPGHKLRQGLLLAGHQMGGNWLLATILSEIYSDGSLWMYAENLSAKFTFLRPETRLLCVSHAGFDLFRGSRSNPPTAEKLKTLITSQSVQLNPRHQEPQTIPNHLNVVFLTGAANPFNESDRRWLVIEPKHDLQLSQQDDYLLSYSNRLERTLALKNLLMRHSISSTALETV